MGNNVLVLVVPLKKKDGVKLNLPFFPSSFRSGSLSEETFHVGISFLFYHFSFVV